MKERLTRILPLAGQLSGYRRADLRGDVVAGLTTAVMLIPQGMAYAMLAGLPPIVGLYASIVPLLVYALLGTSRQLAVGPVAMVSLLVAAGVAPLAGGDAATYVGLAVLLALMVGALQLFMGLARLGFLVNFLSHPVISGFTSAAALIIGFSQLKHLMGMDLPGGHHVHAILLEAGRRLGDTHPVTLALGVGSIALILALKRVSRTFPSALAAVAVTTVLVWGLGLHAGGVKIVGEVPAGLPAPSLPPFSLEAMGALLPTALAIALVGFMESISVAKAFARRHRYEVDANRELVGLGAANVAGSLFGAYPVTGGFSRTAVNAEAGARTGLASAITALVIAAALLFLTPLFHFMPQAVLAAIIMTAVFGLIDAKEVVHLWKVKKSDLALLLLTFFATLSFGIEQGILAGVGASLLWFVVRTTRPHSAVLGRIPGTQVYRNVANHPEAETRPGVLAVRFDAQFYFGNVSFLKDRLRELVGRCDPPVHTVVLDASSINQLDASADAALGEIAADLKVREVRLFVAGAKAPVLEVLRRSGTDHAIGRDRFFLDVHGAMQAASRRPPVAAHPQPAAPEAAPPVRVERPAGIAPSPA